MLRDLDSGNLASILRENENDYEEEPLKSTLLPIPANKITNAGTNIYRNMFVE